MDTLKIGRYIQHLRKAAGMTQKDLAERLNISFQAVSKWENGDTLPDTGLLLTLCDVLDTTADQLLNGGSIVPVERKLLRLADVESGCCCIENSGDLFGRECTFFTGMIEGINSKMNIDLLSYLRVPATREVMYAEVLIQGILSGRTVDMREIEASFQNKKTVEKIRSYVTKTEHNAEVQKKWGDTDAYREYTEKSSHYTDAQQADIAAGMEAIFRAFADCRNAGKASDSQEARALVQALQKYITEHYYTCTDKIMCGLGQMYTADERFRQNIDRHGEGTAAFVSEAIRHTCAK